MTHPIPPDVARLTDRLRQLAEEIESAARFGVMVPIRWSVSGHEYGDVGFAATEHEFAAWVDYTEATVIRSHHHGTDWSAVEVDVNGLPLSFAIRHDAESVSA